MKKLVATVIAMIAVVGCIFLVNDKPDDYLRLHIRANSNSEYDQTIKYEVKDAVVLALTPIVETIKSKDDVMTVLDDNLAYLQGVVDDRLRALGLSYRSRVSICAEEFPTRSYEELTLGAGVYDALIIELGTGEGDNWWCVAFPPLCFVTAEGEGDEIKYDSIIGKWIREARAKG